MQADIDAELARCTVWDLELLVELQALRDECVETDEPLTWAKLELVGFVEVDRRTPPPLVVLTPLGRRACRRLRDAG